MRLNKYKQVSVNDRRYKYKYKENIFKSCLVVVNAGNKAREKYMPEQPGDHIKIKRTG